MLLMKIFAD